MKADDLTLHVTMAAMTAIDESLIGQSHLVHEIGVKQHIVNVVSSITANLILQGLSKHTPYETRMDETFEILSHIGHAVLAVVGEPEKYHHPFHEA